MENDIFAKICTKMRAWGNREIVVSTTAQIVIGSVLCTLVIVGGVLAVVWHYRAKIFQSFATKYAAGLAVQQKAATLDSSATSTITAPSIDPILPEVFSNESLVENAVQKANPAVVAITISKDVPKYTTSYQDVTPDGSGITFQVPVQQQDGYENQQVGAGSGFLISADGMIITNRHVVEDKTATYTVYLSNGKKYPAKVLARDAILDVAIVKIDATALPYLNLGDSSSLKLGQSVIAIGNALGEFQNTVSVGVVSGLSRSITAGDSSTGESEALDHVIQTDAAINPGNSGGPLLDLSGEVVGIDTAIVSGSQSIGFALPINTIKTVINSVRNTGQIVRPYLGIRYTTITPELKDTDKLAYDYGILVAPGEGDNAPAVIPGSPAAKAGIVEGDIILSIDGVKLDADHDLVQLIRQKNVGDYVKLQVYSKGVEKTITLILAPAPQI